MFVGLIKDTSSLSIESVVRQLECPHQATVETRWQGSGGKSGRKSGHTHWCLNVCVNGSMRHLCKELWGTVKMLEKHCAVHLPLVCENHLMVELLYLYWYIYRQYISFNENH